MFKKSIFLLKQKFLTFSVVVIQTMAGFSCDSPGEDLINTPEVPNEYLISTVPGLGDILRTPDAGFEDLKDYAFEPNYVYLEGDTLLRMHYLDEGPEDGRIILLMHGNPSWVYNFRKLIPLLTAEGYRVVCPDLIGFGRSDKPADKLAHTYDNHVRWITKFIEQLDLQQIHLHCQDWGGLISLRVAVLNPSRFEKIAISNTTLPDGTNVTNAFLAWRTSSQTVPNYSFVMEQATFIDLDPLEELAYDAPFPSESLKAGPRQLPIEVPISPDDKEAMENAEHRKTYASWDIPILTIFSKEDNISKGEQERIIADWLGAQGQDHQVLGNSSHFIREDQPGQMAKLLHEFYK